MSFPTLIPGLRSPYDAVSGLVYFGRMLDKIRLHAQGTLPADWVPYLGFGVTNSLDSRCCTFLGLDYEALKHEVLNSDKTDESLLEWAFEHGRRPSLQEIEVWNAFMCKRGWRDSASPYVEARLSQMGLPPGSALTVFEVIDLDEGRITI